MSLPSPFEEPCAPVPFAAMRAEDIEPAFERLVERARSAVDGIAAAAPTYEGTLGELDRATRELDYAFSIAEHLDEVLGTPAHRTAYEAVAKRRSAFYGAMARSELFSASIQRFARSNEARGLDPVRARFLDRTLAELQREGAGLAPRDKARLAEIDAALADETLAFGANATEAIEAFGVVVDDSSRIGGVPEATLAIAAANARARGLAGYRFTLQAPVYVAVLTFAEDRDLRRDLYLGRCTAATGGTVGEPDNRPRIERILALRAERARLLGFASFADHATADRMMKTGSKAMDLIETLMSCLEGAFADETRDLLRFAQGEGAAPLEAWDVAFWAERQRRALHALDGEALRPWFGVGRVLEGLFDLVHRLFGIRIVAAEGATWHPSVSVWEVRDEHEADARGGRAGPIGLVYLDLFARDGKREGAWLSPIYERVPSEAGERVLPSVCVIATDFASPRHAGEQALLSHEEVIRLFHEAGHMLHHVLSEVPIRRLAGTRVAWDFVEFPSMLLETFAWEPEVLQRIARHAETDEPLPASVLDRLLASRRFREVSELVGKLGLATVDLKIHSSYSPAWRRGATAYARDVLARFSPTPLPREYAMLATFSHLFGSTHGYEAAFYSYPWAEVLAADALDRLRAQGLFCADAGAALRREILSRGDGDDAAALFRGFVGRDPELRALLTRLGIDAASP